MGVGTQNGSGPTVAVDAMGGDFAPHEVVKGAIDAHRRGTKVVLVGPRDVVEAELAQLGATLPVVNAPEVIAMDEAVGQAIRRTGSSLRVAADLVAGGEADAVVSCGNSAAIMGVALHVWGRQPGIDRPAFGGTLPARHGSVFVLDIGANTRVKTANLVQFAVMGEVYVRMAMGVPHPRVALLSNGTEDNKGTAEIKEANENLRKIPEMNFIGNIEGNQVFEGAADVVVTDGFTGNILLKVGEGVALELLGMLRSEISKDLVAQLAAKILMPVFRKVRRRVDYEEYGGVPVLGVNGVMINCHGRSKAKAVTNGILTARRVAREGLLEAIGDTLHQDSAEVGRRRRRIARALHLRQQRRSEAAGR